MKTKITEHLKKTGEWGEFFPAHLSPFAYNETLAQYYKPLTREQALNKGLKWKEAEKNGHQKPTTKAPGDISKIGDDFTKEVLSCERCSSSYRVVLPELRFYRKMNIPIPAHCPNCRHLERMSLRNPRKLWQRSCSHCHSEIQTTYDPERQEEVLCEECYLQTTN